MRGEICVRKADWTTLNNPRKTRKYDLLWTRLGYDFGVILVAGLGM